MRVLTPVVLLVLTVLLFMVGCGEDTDPQETAEATPSPTPFFATPEPTSGPQGVRERPTYTATATATGSAIYSPPPPPPPVSDPCAPDPVTGNVEDGDCFAGIPVD